MSPPTNAFCQMQGALTCTRPNGCQIFTYYKSLIALRKAHPAFRMTSTEMIGEHLEFVDTPDDNTLMYRLKGNANGDEWKEILVILNGNPLKKTVSLPDKDWKIAADGEEINLEGKGAVSSSVLTVPGISAMILFKE